MKKRTNKILITTVIAVAVIIVAALTISIQVAYKQHPESFELIENENNNFFQFMEYDTTTEVHFSNDTTDINITINDNQEND